MVYPKLVNYHDVTLRLFLFLKFISYGLNILSNDLVLELFKEVNIAGKVNIKQKLLEIACPTMTSMVPSMHKVKTNDAHKSKVY